MNGLTYEATVVNGLIRLPEHLHLPENSRVLVTVPENTVALSGRIASPRLAHAEQAVDFQMSVREITDAGI